MAEIGIRKKEPPRRTTWGTSDLLRAAAVFAGVYAFLQLLWFSQTILFVAFLGILFGVALSAGVDRLKELGAPRAVGVSAIVLAFFGLLVLFGTIMAPTVREQAEELRVQLPQAIDRVEGWIDEQDGGLLRILLPAQEEDPDEDGEPVEDPDRPAEEPEEARTEAGREADPDPVVGPETQEEAEGAGAQPAPGNADVDGEAANDTLPASETLRQRLTEQLGALGSHLFAFLTSTVAVMGGLLLILFVAVYVAVDPDTYRRGILFLVPRNGRDKAERVLSEVSLMLRRWLVTQLIAMVLVGTVTTIALSIMGVQAALALGILAGLLEFIPIFGPIIAAVPAVAMGFLESPQMALYVLLLYVVVQQLESQLLVPLLMKEGVDLPPVLTVLAQALMAMIFGFIGLLIAVPLLAAAVVVVKLLYVQDVVGEEVILPGEAR